MTNAKIIVTVFIAIILVACTPATITIPTETLVPTATLTHIPPTLTPTLTPKPSPTTTPTPIPITVLDWPFDISVPIASVNYFDLDQICMDSNCVWDDNAHFLGYDCTEKTWPNNNQKRYMSFYRDTKIANVVLYTDGHNGLDLNFPVGTPLVSQWDTTIYTEGDLNVAFLLNDGKLVLNLGHIDYLPNNYKPNTHYQVKRGDIVGWVKAGNGYTFRHRKTGIEYTEIHFEIRLLKDGKRVTKGNYNNSNYTLVDGLIGQCNENPSIKWRTGLDGLTWVGGFLPDSTRLVPTDGGNP